VEVDGLETARWYWYRFHAGRAESPIGRSRTSPRTGDRTNRFAFAFASCQNYEQGLYTAYRHMAEEDLDLVVHLGDYIYEGAMQTGRVRRHHGGEIQTLEDYRNRHALYKTDSLLQLAHARFPWIVTWDDHELDNNYAGDISEEHTGREEFLERRANAYQAYYEHMPLRRASLPGGPELRLYRRLAFGDLAQFYVLDTRQYRSDQPCGDGFRVPLCAEGLSEQATMMGPVQEQWLFDGLERSNARWNVLAQQTMMTKVDFEPGREETYNLDAWDGYDAARRRLLAFLANRQYNPVVITGDIHSNWVCDIKSDFRDPGSPTLATEFVGTSISSGGDGTDSHPDAGDVLPENPQIKFFNSQRGYVRCLLTPERWQSDYRVVPYVTRPGAEVATRASFVVENGHPGAQRS
jgi:alkaline phosphatase D